jgi:hypothetical protein
MGTIEVGHLHDPGKWVTNPETGCEIWQGAKTGVGYGNIKIGGRHGYFIGTHRLRWIEANGPVPKGLIVDHECHNRADDCPGGPLCIHRACGNPDHLRLATYSQNTRSGRPSKISPEDRAGIIKMRKEGAKLREISERYGISSSSASYVGLDYVNNKPKVDA